ncbi:MAG: phage morphogenesis protein [Treponema sp.]|nr:phage morphogenesis protein [Treponema sp.]
MNYRIRIAGRENRNLSGRIAGRQPLMDRIAAAAHSVIVGRVKNGVKPGNAPLTRSVKKGDHTLMDNGRLIASIRQSASGTEAVISSDHVAAVVNNPPDEREYYEIEPKKAKWLTIPASWNTRTLMRRYGFSPGEVLEGLRRDGYSVYRPMRKGSTVRANVIMAKKKGSGKKTAAKKFQPFVVFILSKKIRLPVRRFMYLDGADMALIEGIVEDFYTT